MKKKNDKNGIKRSDDIAKLNTELGTFGLEPPKVYRPEQRSSVNSPDRERPTKSRKSLRSKKRSLKSSENKHLTKKEQLQKRKKKKKLRKAFYTVAIIIAAVVIIAILCLTVFFKIDTITVSGNKRYTAEQILQSVNIEKEDNLILINADKASEELEESLPYIYSAEITRKLPTTVCIKITETKTIYAVKNSDKTYTLTDDNLKVLEQNAASAPDGSIKINKAVVKTAVPGSELIFTDEKISANIKELMSLASKLQLEDITAVYSTGSDENYYVYDSRITIKLGSLDGAEDKIYAALTAINKLNESSPGVEGEINVYNDKQIYFTEKK